MPLDFWTNTSQYRLWNPPLPATRFPLSIDYRCTDYSHNLCKSGNTRLRTLHVHHIRLDTVPFPPFRRRQMLIRQLCKSLGDRDPARPDSTRTLSRMRIPPNK